jgi:tRNA dimethylallyltransferase
MSSADHLNPATNGTFEKSLLPLVIILGPTAVGKSEVSILLAERFGGEIVSSDSRLFYRGMDIGTAKPTLVERARVPHHLIDVAEPDEIWNLGIFQQETYRVIKDILARSRLPFLVGGTGQFIRSITDGWSLPMVTPNPRLREVLTNWAQTIGSITLHSKLALLDPQAARAIDPSNKRRTVRALEVIFSTGKLFSAQRKQGHMLFNPLVLGLTCPRAELYQRIDNRISKMIEAGLVGEVEQLLERGYSPHLPTMTAIGYGEIVLYLDGKVTLDEAIRLMKRRTRIFVRRQANWFREDDPRIHWFTNNPAIVDEMGNMIDEWLVTINWGKAASQIKNPD